MLRKSLVLIAVISGFLAGGTQLSQADDGTPGYWLPRFNTDGIESDAAKRLNEKKLWGYIDTTGKFVIRPQFDTADSFSLGQAQVSKSKHKCSINRSGVVVAQDLSHRRPDEFEVTHCNKDIFDANGSHLIAPQAKDIIVYPVSEGLAAFRMPMHMILNYYPGYLPTSVKSLSSLDRDQDAFGRCGYINEQGRIVIPPQFQHAYQFRDGIAKVEKQGGEWGFIDKKGAVIGNRYFSDRWDFNEGYAAVHDHDGWSFIDKGGKYIAGHFDGVAEFSSGLAAIEENGRWGFIDQKGRIVIPAKFDKVGSFSSGLASAWLDGRIGFINKSGKYVFDGFADAGSFSDGIAAAAVNISQQEKLQMLRTSQEWTVGYIDTNGREIEPAVFAGGRHFKEGLAAIQDKLKWGFIDEDGKVTIEPKFDNACTFSDGLAAVLVRDRWGFIDKTGKFVIAPRFPTTYDNGCKHEPPQSFSEGFALVCERSDQWHYIDKQGHEAFGEQKDSCSPDNCHPFCDGLALVNVWGKDGWCYIDKHGVIKLRGFETGCQSFSEGLAAVGQARTFTCGFIDKTGKYVAQPQFSKAGSFHEGLARVAFGTWDYSDFKGKWGFIDRSGKIVIPADLDDAQDFSEGLAAVQVGERWGFIDQSGRKVIEPKFDRVGPFACGLAVARISDRYGYIDKTGQFTIPPKYWLCGTFSQGRALVVLPKSSKATVTTDAILKFPIRNQQDLQKFLERAKNGN